MTTRKPWDYDCEPPPFTRRTVAIRADPDTDPWGVVEQPVTRHPLAPTSEGQEAMARELERIRQDQYDELFIIGWDLGCLRHRVAQAVEIHTPTAGEQHLAQGLEAAGWVDVEIVPPDQRLYDAPDSIEVRGYDSPDGDWLLHADGGSDGALEGYTVTRIDDDSESERITGPHIPTPNEAVGQWERQQRAALEAAQPRGRKH